MQANLLTNVLPEGAKVGTVDKFQGQEAEVAIVSMASLNGDYLPRDIGILCSKNRLNVAISRAKCMAVFVWNPALMAIRFPTPEVMSLVNTMCWVKEFAGKEHLQGGHQQESAPVSLVVSSSLKVKSINHQLQT
ncbi:DNA2/NAM7 helicase-like, C-terminal [Comamonadaceae bacterium]